MAVLLGLGTVAATSSFAANPALACSCAGERSARDAVGQGEIAFVGTAGPGREEEAGILVHDVVVETAVKGEVPPVVRIEAGMSEAACGAFVPTGVPLGFVPSSYGSTSERRRWSVGLCGGMIDADALRAVVDERLPTPTGEGPVSGIVLARVGPASAVAVAADGRPAGYLVLPAHEGFADLLTMAECPGGATATVLVGRYDVSGRPVGTTVESVALATLEVADEPVATVGSAAAMLSPWSIGGAACLDDTGTTVVLIDDDGDGVAEVLRRIEPTESSDEPLPADATAIEGTQLVEVLDAVVTERSLVDPAAGSAFALDTADAAVDIDVLGDDVFVTLRSGDGSTRIERRARGDGTLLGTWPVVWSDAGRVDVGPAGAIVTDLGDGRRRWLATDGSSIGLPNGGAALLGSGVLTWGYSGPAEMRLADGSIGRDWSFLNAPEIRGVVRVDGTVSVAPDADAAGAVPVIAVAGRIVPADESTDESSVGATDESTDDIPVDGTGGDGEGVGDAASTVVPDATVPADDGRDDGRSGVKVIVGSIAAIAIAAAVATVVGRRRRAGANASAARADPTPDGQ